jgi:hypothetical protein
MFASSRKCVKLCAAFEKNFTSKGGFNYVCGCVRKLPGKKLLFSPSSLVSIYVWMKR